MNKGHASLDSQSETPPAFVSLSFSVYLVFFWRFLYRESKSGDLSCSCDSSGWQRSTPSVLELKLLCCSASFGQA